MLRVLRLKNALQSTVTSPEFVRLNAFKDLAHVILDEDVWVWMYLLARSVYAMMRILRLADQKTAAMDKLYYYIKQADRVAPLYLAQAETYYNKLSDDVVAIMTCTDDLASQNLDGGQDHIDGVDLTEQNDGDDDESVREENGNEVEEEEDQEEEEFEEVDNDVSVYFVSPMTFVTIISNMSFFPTP